MKFNCVLATLILSLLSGCAKPASKHFFDEGVVEMTFDEVDDSVRVNLLNTASYPATSILEIADSEKYSIKYSSEQPVTIAAKEQVLIYDLAMRQPFTVEEDLQPWLRQIPGSLQIDEAFNYALPCGCGVSCAVSDTSGMPSHEGWSKFAVDFALPEGSKIYAMRAGLVINVEVNSKTNCREYTRECDQHANRILVASEDGAMIHYLHLKHDSAFVQVGDRVKQHQLLGLSGDTGYATGPHLHVDVTKVSTNMMEVTTPMIFSTSEGVLKLSEGENYFRAGCSAVR